jgi:hypothetical protein
LVPKILSPASPKPGSIYPLSFSESSIAAIKRSTSGCNSVTLFSPSGAATKNSLADLTGIDIGIGKTDEDVAYFGQKTALKAEIKTVSGVSSIIKATPVSFSKVVIFLPSLPINFPFISSLGISITVVVTSLVTSQAYC